MATSKTTKKTSSKTRAKKAPSRKKTSRRPEAAAGRASGEATSAGTGMTSAGEHRLDEVPAHEKTEVRTEEEHTVPGRFYRPHTDVYETADALLLVMDMPGVEREQIEIRLDENVLSVEGRIDLSKYRDLRPVYTEYNVGHFARSFTIADTVDRGAITATVADGVLTLELPKATKARARRIPIE